jgi:CheY-like chemotaxis protein
MQPPKRILCVEPDNDTSFMLTHLLEHAGYQAQSVGTASEALGLGEGFNLYLLDNRLPDRNGIELCRELRMQNPHTPIVFYSGDVYPQQRSAATEAGASAYVDKPEIGKLLTVLKDLLPN